MMQHCHFIGIGGIGMSGLAHILLKKKITVSGSDLAATVVVEQLKEQGASVFIGHHPSNIPPGAVVVVSSGIPADNSEYRAAVAMNSPIYHRSDILAFLMKDHQALAVAGTHGKTTTSSLLSWVLLQADCDPSFAVGGIMTQLSINARLGTGPFFVAEADESDGSFLKYQPFGAIVTNIGLDHLDHYGNEKNLITAFYQFCLGIQSSVHLFFHGDDQRINQLQLAGVSYGFSDACQWRAANFVQKGWRIYFDIHNGEKIYPQVEVALTGRHNACNATAVFGLCLSLGLSEEQIRAGLKTFAGVRRRAEKIGEQQAIQVIDDYAHHPNEIRSTLRALREVVREKRLIILFQPHRYSRTQHCFADFAASFDLVDQLIVTDIYSAGEKPLPNVSSPLLVEAIGKKISAPVTYIERACLAEALLPMLRPHDVVVTMGAGDIGKFGKELLTALAKSLPKLQLGLVFGGRSVEHEISLTSARFFLSHARSDLYELSSFGITKDGLWMVGEEAQGMLSPGYKKQSATAGQVLSDVALQALQACDLALPVLHGPFGEDGTIQGFFEMVDLPYFGCNQLASAICMDKVMTKKVVAAAGIKTAPFLTIRNQEWLLNKDPWIAKVKHHFALPVYVKAIHLGSSVGIYQITDWEQLSTAIDTVLKDDFAVLIEQRIEGREFEIAVLGTDWIEAFPPGEIFTEGKCYSYLAKYGPNAMATSPRAQLDQELIEAGKKIAITAYRAVGCTGMARVDLFLEPAGDWVLSEINPIPGFTPNSLFHQMCYEGGIPPSELIDRLVVLALHNHALRQRNLAKKR